MLYPFWALAILADRLLNCQESGAEDSNSSSGNYRLAVPAQSERELSFCFCKVIALSCPPASASRSFQIHTSCCSTFLLRAHSQNQ